MANVFLSIHLLIQGSGTTIFKVQQESYSPPLWSFGGFDRKLTIDKSIDKNLSFVQLLCPTKTCFQQQIGDGVCHLESDNTECCFDGGDCSKGSGSFIHKYGLFLDFHHLCPECERTVNVIKVGNHACDSDIEVSLDCCFDAGDCQISNDTKRSNTDIWCNNSQEWFQMDTGCEVGNKLESLCATCPATKNQTLLDGFCSHDLANDPACCFEALDCNECTTCYKPDFVSDSYCDNDLLTAACCLDGGDCDSNHQIVMQSSMLCHDCNFPKYLPLVSDGACNIELANQECCFDGGDCLPTNINSFIWCSSCISKADAIFYDVYLNNGICETQYNTPHCCFDGGDCDTQIQDQLCPQCHLDHYQDYVTNKRCDTHFNNPDCCYDGGSCQLDTCSTCICEELKLLINNGVCDSVLIHNPTCCHDGDDCMNDIGKIDRACPTCQVSGSFAFLGTGQCDQFMDNQQCCYDGGDCLTNLCDSCDDQVFYFLTSGLKTCIHPY